MHNDGPAVVLGMAMMVVGFIGAAALVLGYIMNIVKLVGMNWDAALTILGVVRIVGVVVLPLGGIVGWVG